MKTLQSIVTIQFRSFLSMDQLQGRNKICFEHPKRIIRSVSNINEEDKQGTSIRAIFLFDSSKCACEFYHFSMGEISRCEGLIPSSIKIKMYRLKHENPQLSANPIDLLHGLLPKNHEKIPCLP